MTAVQYALILYETEADATEILFSPAPQTIRYESPASTTLLRLPYGNSYREGLGMGIESCAVSGTFGFRKRQVGGEELTGAELFSRLDGLYRRYQTLRASRNPQERKAYLVWHDFVKDRHWRCEMVTFIDPKDRNNRTFFRYDFTLRLYQLEARKFNVEAAPRKELRKAKVQVDQGSNAIRDGLDKIQQIRRDAGATLTREVLQPLRNLSDALGEAIATGGAIVAFPFARCTQVADAIADVLLGVAEAINGELQTLANNLRATRRAIYRLARFPELFAQEIQDGTEALLNAMLRDPDAPSAFDPALPYAEGLRTGRTTGARRVRTQQGDTLTALASRELGDARRWREIALLNGLDRAPYLTPTGANGTARFGDELLIPDVQGGGGGVQGALASSELIAQSRTATRLYGRDLRVAERSGGKLDIALASNGDPLTIEGEDNLLQAAGFKTRIMQGELLENPAWGLRRTLGRKTTQGERDLLRFGLRESVESDPRIESARIEIRQSGNTQEILLDLKPTRASGRVSGIVGRA